MGQEQKGVGGFVECLSGGGGGPCKALSVRFSTLPVRPFGVGMHPQTIMLHCS